MWFKDIVEPHEGSWNARSKSGKVIRFRKKTGKTGKAEKAEKVIWIFLPCVVSVLIEDKRQKTGWSFCFGSTGWSLIVYCLLATEVMNCTVLPEVGVFRQSGHFSCLLADFPRYFAKKCWFLRTGLFYVVPSTFIIRGTLFRSFHIFSRNWHQQVTGFLADSENSETFFPVQPIKSVVPPIVRVDGNYDVTRPKISDFCHAMWPAGDIIISSYQNSKNVVVLNIKIAKM